MSTLANENNADAIIVIDALARKYADARTHLAAAVQDLNAAVEELRRQHLPHIKQLAARAADRQATLSAQIAGHPDLFVKPRTMTLHGIKVGFQKGKGVLTHEDTTEKVVERIKSFFGDDAVQYLIIAEKPRAAALLELPAATLRKLGLQVQDTGDAVFIKATDGEIDKLVARLLDEGSKIEGAAS